MDTTRSYRQQSGYTLPPEAVEAAGKAVDDTLPASLEMSRAEWMNTAATAAITAFIDHMVSCEYMEREDQHDGFILYSMMLPAAKEPTT